MVRAMTVRLVSKISRAVMTVVCNSPAVVPTLSAALPTEVRAFPRVPTCPLREVVKLDTFLPIPEKLEVLVNTLSPNCPKVAKSRGSVNNSDS